MNEGKALILMAAFSLKSCRSHPGQQAEANLSTIAGY